MPRHDREKDEVTAPTHGFGALDPKDKEKPSPGTVTLEQLIQMVADLAEEVAHGTAGHIRTAAQNKSLAVLKALRPDTTVTADPEPGENCGKPRVKDDPDSEICLRAKGHEGGHAFGIVPKPEPAPAA